MNNIIANVLKGYVDTLSWADKTAGLVQTANIQVDSVNGSVSKSFPISCDVAYDALFEGDYQPLTPDSKYSSVIYFEDGGCQQIEKSGNKLKMQSHLRLVCWLNLNKIDDSCGISGKYVIDVIKHLPSSAINTADFTGLYINSIEQVVRSVDIFGKYTYDEHTTQFLMYPYDYFALELSITFYIPCINTP